MARVPRLMLDCLPKYLLGEQSPITEKDFTPQELSEMLRMVQEQESRNIQEETNLQRSLTAYQRNLETFDSSKNLVT